MWEAFDALSEKRLNTEAGPQPIPFTEIACYMDLMYIVDEGQREDLLFFISAMDREYIKVIHEKREKERQKNEKKSKRRAKSSPRGR